MTEKVDLVFNYGGKWVLSPQVVYIKKLNETWHDYDVDLLSYIDICSEFIEKCEFRAVKQMLVTVTGPTDRDIICFRMIQALGLYNLLCLVSLVFFNYLL